MKRSQLEELLALILNEADFSDLEVIKAALERRQRDLNTLGRGSFNPGARAKNLAESIQGQVGASMESLTNLTRNFVEDMIRQQVPDISEAHLRELLAEWVPNAAEKAKRAEAARAKPQAQRFPPDVLAVMIRDFVSYSTGAMSASYQVKLKDEIGDWEKLYWDSFPERVQKLIHVFLNGKLDVETFWAEIRSTIGQTG